MTLAITLEEVVPLSEVEGESDLKVAFLETSDGESSDGKASDGKASDVLKDKWLGVDAKTTVWKENIDTCGNNMTCRDGAFKC